MSRLRGQHCTTRMLAIYNAYVINQRESKHLVDIIFCHLIYNNMNDQKKGNLKKKYIYILNTEVIKI